MSPKESVIKIVKQIPAGKVTNYGAIASALGLSPRTVGWILSGMPESEWSSLPWQRVVAKDGFISTLKMGPKGMLQKELLLQEGCSLIGDKVDMQKHYWEPK